MNIRAQLMLMAATLAPLPLYAQDAAPAAPVAAPAAQLPAELAAVSPLSLIPADADAAFVLTHAGKRICEIHGENARAKAIGSIAVGASKGNARLAADFCALQSQAQVYDLRFILTYGLFYILYDSQPLGQIVEKELGASQREAQGIMNKIAAGMKLHPLYCVVSIPEGQEDFVKAELKELEGEIRKAAEKDPNREFVAAGDLFGAKFTIPPQKKHERMILSGDKLMENVLACELEKRTIYMLMGMKDGHAVGVICEDPAEISFAGTPDQSILSTEAWQGIRPNLQDDLIFAASLSADTLNQTRKARMQPFLDFVAGLSDPVEFMADVVPDAAGKLKAASAGLQAIAAQAGKHLDSATVDKPAFLQVWGTEDAFHAEISFDAAGGSFAPAKADLSENAEDAGTVLCIEATPYHNASCCAPASVKAMGAAVADIVDGVIAISRPEIRTKAESYKQVAMGFLPDAAAIGASLHTMADGLGGTTGLVIDSKADLPRVAFYSGVANRAKLAQGWDALLHAAGDTLEKCGQDRSMLQMLPIVPMQLQDGATAYTVALPWLTADLGANATVSDHAFAIGSSANLNAELVTTGTAHPEFAGVTLTLNTAALADAADKVAEAIESSIEPEDVLPASEAEDAPKSPAVQRAEDAKEIAKNLQGFSRFIKQVKGGMTIKNGLQTIRVDALLK